VPATDPQTAAGLVLIRVWVEPSATGRPGDGLRARIFTVDHAHPEADRMQTVAGRERVIGAVRAFLASLTTSDATPAPRAPIAEPRRDP
jgi:hypothetical protein